MAKQVRLTLAKAIAKANLRRAEVGEKPITMNSLAVQAGVSATTITRLARPVDDPKAASALSLDLASKIVTVLDCGIEDLMEVIDREQLMRVLHITRYFKVLTLPFSVRRSHARNCISQLIITAYV